jgi:hypothetical protein
MMGMDSSVKKKVLQELIDALSNDKVSEAMEYGKKPMGASVEITKVQELGKKPKIEMESEDESGIDTEALSKLKEKFEKGIPFSEEGEEEEMEMETEEEDDGIDKEALAGLRKKFRG